MYEYMYIGQGHVGYKFRRFVKILISWNASII